MKPEVQAAIESRRQWFWVWMIGVFGGIGLVTGLRLLGNLPDYSIAVRLETGIILILGIAGIGLLIKTLRLQKSPTCWTLYIAATLGLILRILIGMIENLMG